MAKVLCPFVYWAQSSTEITLRVDLKDCKDPDIQIEAEEIEFQAVGVGSHGEQRYRFLLEFYLPVDKDSAVCDVLDREVRIRARKQTEDWWPRLLYSPAKLPWLKLDFDRVQQQESDSEPEEPKKSGELSYEDILRSKYPEAYKQLKKEELGFINESWRKNYLFCYNLFMFCGFLYVLVILSLRYMADQEVFPTKAWTTVGNVFKFLHLLMFLEVLNPLFGYTKGSVIEAAIQVCLNSAVTFQVVWMYVFRWPGGMSGYCCS